MGELLVLLLLFQPAVMVMDPVHREGANEILPLYSGEHCTLQHGILPLPLPLAAVRGWTGVPVCAYEQVQKQINPEVCPWTSKP